MDKLRIAVIGAGRMGGFHAQKLATMPDVELVAIVDPFEENARRVAQACNTRSLTDHEPLLDGLDAAVVAAPSGLHHSIGQSLLARGIHVLVEKPMCVTSRTADELVEASRESGAVLHTGHVERFNPAFIAARDRITAPKYIDATRTSPFTFRSTDVGVVFDMMIHDIDLVLGLVQSSVRKVDALGLAVIGEFEDVANARIEFENGCVATLSASRVSFESVRRMQVWSREAFASIDFASRKTTVVRPSSTILHRRFNLAALRAEEVEHLKKHLFDEHLPSEQLEFDPVDALTLELRRFIDCIRTPQARLDTRNSGRDAVALAEEIVEKIEYHAWDDAYAGPAGPLAIPPVPFIPEPNFAAAQPLPLRRAG